MGNVAVNEARNVNAIDLVTYRYVVVSDPEVSVKTLTARVTK
jgi:hypothetical protein